MKKADEIEQSLGNSVGKRAIGKRDAKGFQVSGQRFACKQSYTQEVYPGTVHLVCLSYANIKELTDTYITVKTTFWVLFYIYTVGFCQNLIRLLLV